MSGNPSESEVIEKALRQYAEQVEGEVEEVRAGFLAMVEQNGIESTLVALEENRKLIERMGW
jgi:hypothetical protein